MGRSLVFGVVAIAAFSSAVSAQQTWVVDAAGGAGSHYTSVQPAVAAAAPGDRIEVRGTHYYAGFLVDRGVDVDAVDGAICQSVTFDGVPAGQSASAAGFANVVEKITVEDCLGSILLHDIAMTTLQTGVALQLVNSDLVYANDLTIHWLWYANAYFSVVELTDSNLVLEQCSLKGPRGEWFGGVGGSVLYIDYDSHATVIGGELVGGIGEAAQYQGPGIGCVGPGMGGIAIEGPGRCVLAGGVGVYAGQGQQGGSPCQSGYSAQHALVGVTATIAPGCVVSPSCGWCPAPELATFDAPASAPLGTTVSIDIHGPPGFLVGIGGDLNHGYLQQLQFSVPWTLTANALPVGLAVIPASGTASFTQAIPNQAALLHLDVFYQGVSWSGSALDTTGPTTLHVR